LDFLQTNTPCAVAPSTPRATLNRCRARSKNRATRLSSRQSSRSSHPNPPRAATEVGVQPRITRIARILFILEIRTTVRRNPSFAGRFLTTDFTDTTDRKCLIREIREIRGHSDLVAALPRWEIRGQQPSHGFLQWYGSGEKRRSDRYLSN